MFFVYLFSVLTILDSWLSMVIMPNFLAIIKLVTTVDIICSKSPEYNTEFIFGFKL